MVAAHGEFAVKGDKSRYTAMNGNMFSFVTTEGEIAVRLSTAEQTAFLGKHPDATVVQYGAVMRGYVRVPESIARRPAALAELFASSVAFARTLPAKPTTRGGKAAAEQSAGKKPAAPRKKATKKAAKKTQKK